MRSEEEEDSRRVRREDLRAERAARARFESSWVVDWEVGDVMLMSEVEGEGGRGRERAREKREVVFWRERRMWRRVRRGGRGAEGVVVVLGGGEVVVLGGKRKVFR